MLTPQLMKSMDIDRLVASARAEIGPLTSTPLELELLDRIETLLDEADNQRPIADLLDEYEASADDIRALLGSHPASLKDQAALLSLLNDHGIEEPGQLKALIDLVSTNQE